MLPVSTHCLQTDDHKRMMGFFPQIMYLPDFVNIL